MFEGDRLKFESQLVARIFKSGYNAFLGSGNASKLLP